MTHIAKVEPEDIPYLVTLEEQFFSSDRISRRQFRYLTNKANSIVVKAVHSKIIVGYMILLKRKKSSRLRIYSIGVALSTRRQGVAKAMLAYAEDMAAKHHCSQLTLEVCDQNSSAIQSYYKAGFYQYGLKNNYYEDGSTALLLHKDILLKDTPL